MHIVYSLFFSSSLFNILPLTLHQCHLDSLERTVGSQSHSISVTLTVNPSTSTGRVPKVDVPLSSSLTLPPSMTREEAISAICNGVEMACLNGNWTIDL